MRIDVACNDINLRIVSNNSQLPSYFTFEMEIKWQVKNIQSDARVATGISRENKSGSSDQLF